MKKAVFVILLILSLLSACGPTDVASSEPTKTPLPSTTTPAPTQTNTLVPTESQLPTPTVTEITDTQIIEFPPQWKNQFDNLSFDEVLATYHLVGVLQKIHIIPENEYKIINGYSILVEADFDYYNKYGKRERITVALALEKNGQTLILGNNPVNNILSAAELVIVLEETNITEKQVYALKFGLPRVGKTNYTASKGWSDDLITTLLSDEELAVFLETGESESIAGLLVPFDIALTNIWVDSMQGLNEEQIARVRRSYSIIDPNYPRPEEIAGTYTLFCIVTQIEVFTDPSQYISIGDLGDEVMAQTTCIVKDVNGNVQEIIVHLAMQNKEKQVTFFPEIHKVDGLYTPAFFPVAFDDYSMGISPGELLLISIGNSSPETDSWTGGAFNDLVDMLSPEDYAKIINGDFSPLEGKSLTPVAIGNLIWDDFHWGENGELVPNEPLIPKPDEGEATPTD